VGDVEEDRNLTEKRTGLGPSIDLKVSFQHFELSFDQDVENACSFSFGEEHLARAEGCFREILTKAKNRAHHYTSTKNHCIANIIGVNVEERISTLPEETPEGCVSAFGGDGFDCTDDG
jgi:hypothetical protein